LPVAIWSAFSAWIRRICLRVRSWLKRIFADREKAFFEGFELSDVRLIAIGFQPSCSARWGTRSGSRRVDGLWQELMKQSRIHVSADALRVSKAIQSETILL
jgi:hypothetical protein